MPIVTLTVRKPQTLAFKNQVLQAVHSALVGIGVNERDVFHRVLELSAEDFRFDATYPDAASPRGDNFVLIEILLGVGRSVKVKKQLLQTLVAALAAQGHDPEHVMVVFQDVPWENWSAAGGRVLHA
jgi:phenylpyruvate tautomerase PptA (4-oxalocrotonate tautomerase family)